MYKIKSKGWLDITGNPDEDIRDGFWVIFLRRNITKSHLERKNFINRVNEIAAKYKLSLIRILQPYSDRLVVYTSCDGNEITYIKDMLKRELRIKDKFLYWKADFESEENWASGEWLNLLNNTYSAYEKIIASYTKKKGLKNIQQLKSLVYQKILEEQCMNRKSMVIRPVFSPINYGSESKFIFVLMPFSEDWSADVYDMIKEVERETETYIKRADDFLQPGIIIDDIWNNINKASLIIADITTHNANVFYELGIAHTLGKKVLLIKQKKNGKEVPFDIKPWRYLEYDIGHIEANKFKKSISQIILSSIKSTE